MWNTRLFDSYKAMALWIARNKRRYQIEQIFVNNYYAVEYRPLRKICEVK